MRLLFFKCFAGGDLRIADRFGSWQCRWFEIVVSLFDRPWQVHTRLSGGGLTSGSGGTLEATSRTIRMSDEELNMEVNDEVELLSQYCLVIQIKLVSYIKKKATASSCFFLKVN